MVCATMFRFKQFEIRDELSAMKIGTDGVLLGAWVNISNARTILDIGTGTGLVALMCAQRNSEATIEGIDIVEDAVIEARQNVANSPWLERITITHSDIRSYNADMLYDHIVSNPPFFHSSLHSPDAARTTARHTTTLSYLDLITASERLLRPEGRLSVVLPTDCAMQFRRMAFERLWLRRITDVVTREGETPKRTMMEFQLTTTPLMPRHNTLTIHHADGSYTEQYRRITEEFYLNF